MNKLALRGRALCLLFVCLGKAEDGPASPPAVDAILSQVAAADKTRQAQLAGYTSIRNYLVENRRFRTTAKMRVQLTVDPRGAKSFQVLEMSGPLPVRKLVFQRMLDTEAKASTGDGQQATRIAPANYTFRWIETASWQGRKCFILEAEPKSSSSLLFRGRVWVDADEHAVVRIEGSPAKNPSFWVNKTGFVHEYTKVGPLWLPKSNTSETDVRIFGRTTVRIDYGDYKLTSAPGAGPGD